MEYNNIDGNIGEIYTKNPAEIDLTGYLDEINGKKTYDNFVENTINSYDLRIFSLLPLRKLPECWEEIESLILKRIGEYPEIEVGGLLLTNSAEFGELSYHTGDETSIKPENFKYRFKVDSEELEKIFYHLKDGFVMRESGRYVDRFLSEIKERGLQGQFEELVIENLENPDSDSTEVLDTLDKLEVKKPKEFDPHEDLVYINYHSHPNGYLKPSGTDIESARKGDKAPSKILYVIAGKGRCKWSELRMISPDNLDSYNCY